METTGRPYLESIVPGSVETNRLTLHEMPERITRPYIDHLAILVEDTYHRDIVPIVHWMDIIVATDMHDDATVIIPRIEWYMHLLDIPQRLGIDRLMDRLWQEDTRIILSTRRTHPDLGILIIGAGRLTLGTDKESHIIFGGK